MQQTALWHCAPTSTLASVGAKQIEESRFMKQIRIVLLFAALTFVATALGQGTTSAAAASAPQAQQPPTIASMVDREISTIERQIVEAAEAMPADKFDFSPESLNIPGDDYKGVRTFALQVKHVAASNYFLWSALTGDKIPDNFKGGNGPENLKTKAEIIKFLKDSFVLGHKAAATLTTQNMLQTAEGSKSHACIWPHLPSPTPLITTDRWWSTCG
jgi:hypothetical protein